jgi:hypothetical protein
LTLLLCCFVCRLVHCLCSSAITAPLLQQQSLWLGLLQQVLVASPRHAGLAALQLPLVAAGSDADAAATVGAGASSAEAAFLLQVWQAVGSWSAMPGVRGRSAGRHITSSSIGNRAHAACSMRWRCHSTASYRTFFQATLQQTLHVHERQKRGYKFVQAATPQQTPACT